MCPCWCSPGEPDPYTGDLFPPSPPKVLFLLPSTAFLPLSSCHTNTNAHRQNQLLHLTAPKTVDSHRICCRRALTTHREAPDCLLRTRSAPRKPSPARRIRKSTFARANRPPPFATLSLSLARHLSQTSRAHTSLRIYSSTASRT